MADRLPPLDIPDELLTGPSAAQVEHNANWALTFGGSDTSLAQRAGHDRDLAAYAQRLQESQAAHQQQILQQDAGARALYFKQQELRRQTELDRIKRGHEDAMLPLKMESEKARAAAALALEKQRVQSDLRQHQTDEHAANFQAEREAFLYENPTATQEDIDANDLKNRLVYPGANRADGTKDIIAEAVKRTDVAAKAKSSNSNSPEWLADGSMRVGTNLYRYNAGGDLVKIGVEPNHGTGGNQGEDAVTIHEKLDDNLSATRKVAPADLDKLKRDKLLKQHAELEGALNAYSGEKAPTTKDLAEINAVKSQLGFAQLDASGKAMPIAGEPAVAPAPDITPEAHAALKAGDKFWWKGQQLTKQ